MRFKVRILGSHPREFLLDGDFENSERARPQAKLVLEEDRSDSDTGYKVIAVPEIPHKEVTDDLLRRFFNRYREINWPTEDLIWRQNQVDSAVSSFRAGLDKGYEPDGQRWGIQTTHGGYPESKVRFRIRDDFKGGMWVRFVIYANCIGVEEPTRGRVLSDMIAIVEALEGEFPVVGER